MFKNMTLTESVISLCIKGDPMWDLLDKEPEMKEFWHSSSRPYIETLLGGSKSVSESTR